MSDKNISALLQVLNSEQQITGMTDQKAFTMLSILGVFMVFFIVHFLKLQMNWFIFTMVIIYFGSANSIFSGRYAKRSCFLINGFKKMGFDGTYFLTLSLS